MVSAAPVPGGEEGAPHGDALIERPGGSGAVPLIAPSLAYGVAAGVTLACSLVRGKVFALVLGPTGLGTIAQLNVLAAALAAIAPLGLGTAAPKVVAAARERGDTTDEHAALGALFL